MNSLAQCLALASSILITSHSSAAACCGGGASFPSLILSDDRAQFGLSASLATVIGDAPTAGKPIFRAAGDDEIIQTYSIDGAYVFSERWQAGVSVPLLHKSRSTSTNSASSTGLGDVFATLGYEFLPEYSYSRIKPRIFIFSTHHAHRWQHVRSESRFRVNSRGKGFFTPVVGTFLLKSWSGTDASLRLSVAQSVPQSFKSSAGTRVSVRPGLEVNAALGAGWSPAQGDFRLGLSINPAYEAPSNVSTYKLVWNTALDVSYLVKRQWLFQLAYSDQTLLGPAKNTALQRSLQFALRYKWPQ